MNAFWISASLIIFLFLAFLMGGWRNVPSNTFVAAKLFGRYRTAIREGWQWWWPEPFGSTEPYSRKPILVGGTKEDRIVVNTKQEAGASNQVTLGYSFPISPDIRHLDVFREWDLATIMKDLKAEVKSQLTILGGQYSYADFIASHRAIETIIDCLLRLESLPHHNARSFKKDDDSNWDHENVVPVEKRIAFYTDCHAHINQWLKSEGGREDEMSKFEEKYGIDIDNFHLDPAEFTEEMKEALEMKQETTEKLGAVVTITEMIKRVAHELPLLPITEVKDLVQTTLGIPTEILTTRGAGQVDLYHTTNARSTK